MTNTPGDVAQITKLIEENEKLKATLERMVLMLRMARPIVKLFERRHPEYGLNVSSYIGDALAGDET